MEDTDTKKQLLEEAKEELMKYEDFDPDTIVEKYKELAEKYDETLLNVVGYPDPSKIVEALVKMEISKDARILDFGCGTGLIGENCKKEGYTEVVGIDASPDMLEKAKDRGYTELKEVYLGNHTFPEEYEGKFDVAVSSGLLAHGHVSADVFEEKLKWLKKKENDDDKRYMIFTTREEYLDTLGYGDKLKELEDNKKIEFVDKLTFTRYQNTENAEVSRFKPTQVSCFIYKANV